MEEIKYSYEKFNSQISTYSNKNNYKNIDSKETIEFIHNNISNVDKNNIIDEILAKNILLKIFSPEKIEKECLIFDLLNYSSNNKANMIDDSVSICIDALKKYQYKAGGYNIEDVEWILCDQNNNRFKVKDNQKILYNSVHKKSCDRELIWFLDSILDYVKRHTNSEKIKVKYNMFEDEKNCVCWIIFKFNLIQTLSKLDPNLNIIQQTQLSSNNCVC
jgi:hypothetical protein